MDVDPGLDLKKYPVAVYVPKEYDGSRPYGLVISMMNAKSSSQFPKPEYIASLSSRRLIYVGFDPYNRVYEDGSSDDYRVGNHERFILAILYHMLGAYGLDRSRIYLTGFSWGGRLTGQIVPFWPKFFTGGIAVGGCFTVPGGNLLCPSYRYARDRATMVCVSGDWDYNRGESYNGYNAFASLGFEAYYFQEPMRGHARISGEYFERALGLLDSAAERRAAAKK
jgi:predicted esterase